MNKNTLLLLIAFILLPLKTFALDNASKDALDKTKELLVDPTKRQEAVKKDPKAVKADDFAKSVGGKNTEDIYALASKVFEKLVIKYNGDADKIQEVLGRAAKDPASFANSEFTAEELTALRELAAKLPAAAPSGK